MNKTLAAIVLMTSAAVAKGDTLLEKVEDYLDKHGLPRIEYFQRHQIMLTSQGSISYDQMYLLDNKVLLARFLPYDPQQIDQSSAFMELDKGADFYRLENKWYIDEACDGINGNEDLY